MQDNPVIVFLGESTFPHGFAAIQRLTLMARTLNGAGCHSLVICRKGNHPVHMEEFPLTGTAQGVNYHYTVDSIYRPKGFLSRNWTKIKGILNEYRFLKSLMKERGIAAGILSTHSSFHGFRYRVFSKLIGFRLYLNYVEMASAMEHHTGLKQRLNDLLFDRWILKLNDGALPISEVLSEHYRKKAPNSPVFKLPIICDFEEFAIPGNPGKTPVFLFCGSASYLEIIDFVLSAFEDIDRTEISPELHLIVGGSGQSMDRVREKIAASASAKKITLLNNIDRAEIPIHFANASALLIPLRSTLQDRARFPHKIGEYLASGSPIITTAIGEINQFPFKDKHNALIASSYDVEKYTSCMDFVVANPDKASSIGIKGRELGLNYFEFMSYGPALKKFLNTTE